LLLLKTAQTCILVWNYGLVCETKGKRVFLLSLRELGITCFQVWTNQKYLLQTFNCLLYFYGNKIKYTE